MAQYIGLLTMKKNGKVKPSKQNGHLIQQLSTGKAVVKEETKEQQEIIQCKYGIFCAHLRAAGACSYPHRRHHYLLLNLVPPANYLEDLDEAEEEIKLTKKQRKQKKIIEKTISQHIDVQALTKQEQLNKQNAEAQIKQQFLQNMNEVQRQVVDIVTVESAEQYFAKLSEYRKEGNVFELKKRSLIQLKKKSEKVYADIIDKEYRIANRLIKESIKNTKNSLIQIYEDINHNTIPSVRQFFEAYLQPNVGVIHEDSSFKHHLSKIINSVFLREPNQFKSQYYMVHLKSSLSQVKCNVEFYNMLVPFLHSQAQPFNKYMLLDCQEDLSLTNISQLLTQDHSVTFHAKCKPAPEYPFGQLANNLEKFTQWASKISKKYNQTNKESNIIFILNNIQKLFLNPNAQEFEQEKLKQRRQTFRKILKIFSPVIYFLTPSLAQRQRKDLSELLELQSHPNTKFECSLEVLEQK